MNQGASASALLARRWTLGAGLVLAALALLGGHIPLFEVPGYELALAGAVAAALVGGPLGVAAARLERAGREPSALSAFGAALTATVVLLAVMLGLAWVRGAIFSPCSPGANVLFFPVLALPSALLACAAGVACGFAAGGGGGYFAYAACVAASLFFTLRAAYLGPQAYAYDHFLGYWPGPLYDEAVRIGGPLLAFRAVTLLWALFALCVAAGLNGSGGARVAAVLVALSLFAAHLGRARLGYETTHAKLLEALGGVKEGPRCRLVYPREKRPDLAERLWRDCEYDAAAVAQELDLAKPPRITVYVYRSPDEKRALVGAGQTSFTKPWLREIHVNDEPSPHPVLRHEIVHALAAAYSHGLLRVPARFGVLVSAGLVEGLAVAFDVPHGEWTVHEQARAMRDLGVMPAPAAIVGPAGFLAAAPARAYTVAGSFLRWLADTYGAGKVLAVYGGAPFDKAFGKDLVKLQAEWARFLDGVAVAPELRAAAEERFRAPSLFAQPCAREVASLDEAARSLSARGRVADAARAWRRAAVLTEDPAYRLSEGDAWLAASELARAETAYDAALGMANARGGLAAVRARALSELGDLRWRAGDTAGAAQRYGEALPLAGEPSQRRLLRAKLAALNDPPLRAAAAHWLLQLGDPAAGLARLAVAPPSPMVNYLLGRALWLEHAPNLALPHLAAAAAQPLLSPEFDVENEKTLAQAACEAGDTARADEAFAALAKSAPREADRLRAADDAKRCDFERAQWKGPVTSPEDAPL